MLWSGKAGAFGETLSCAPPRPRPSRNPLPSRSIRTRLGDWDLSPVQLGRETCAVLGQQLQTISFRTETRLQTRYTDTSPDHFVCSRQHVRRDRQVKRVCRL
jgi:hypothetical protein